MKKTLLIIAFLLFSITVFSQEEYVLDSLLVKIDQSSVTSGIIYERVFPAANLYGFNHNEKFDTADFSYFKQALSEMHRASNNTKFISLEAFEDRVKDTLTSNEVNLAILNTDFHILHYNEDSPEEGGLLYDSITNKLTSIAGRPPFLRLYTTVIAPAKDYAVGTSVVYKIKDDLYFNNGAQNIKKLTADFGDGISRILIDNGVLTNQNITINYTESGKKVSHFEVVYFDDTTVTTKGILYFHYAVNNELNNSSCFNGADTLKEDFTLQSDIPFTGYKSTDPTIKAKIEYRVFYANSHTDKKLRNPIIILDGFDPGDTRRIEDCDCASDPACAFENSNFSTGFQFDPDRHESFVDLMYYYDPLINDTRSLLDKLREVDYDVIIVNFPKYTTKNLQNNQNVTIDGGAYYIESNAYAVVKLLQQTNQKLIQNGSTSKIVVIGPSMGGLISRYALAYMEKNHIDHNTRLWVSVDSPHLGANVPLGVQGLIYRMKKMGVQDAGKAYDNSISSPAAQQMLIEFYKEKVINPIPIVTVRTADPDYLNGQTPYQGMPYNKGNPYFIQHYSNQGSNGLPYSGGWPQNLRKITMVNGSLSGSRKTVLNDGTPYFNFAQSGNKVLNFRGFQNIGFFFPITIHIASIEAQFIPTYTSDNKKIARFKKAFADSSTYSQNINTRGVMDNVPGGFFTAQAEITDGVPSYPTKATSANIIDGLVDLISTILGGAHWDIHQYNPVHSFIPTFSAMAHLESNQSWHNPLDTNLVCENLTPFDSYFGMDKNSLHVSFTKESVNWLIQELQGNEQDPYFPVNPANLEGTGVVCSTSSHTYEFNDMCAIPGEVANWSVTNKLTILSSGAYEVVVKGVNGINGWATITATFQNGATVSKQVWVGKPETPFLGGESFPSVPSNSLAQFSAIANGASSYQWKIAPIDFQVVSWYNTYTNAWQILASQVNSDNIMAYTGNPGTNGTVGVRACNICGCSDWISRNVTLSSTGVGITDYFTVYPNPSSTVVNIGLIDENHNPGIAAVIRGDLFDYQGFHKGDVQIINNKAAIDVSGLPKGIYILQISVDGRFEGHQIIVQ